LALIVTIYHTIKVMARSDKLNEAIKSIL
jgi:hypothetical protein